MGGLIRFSTGVLCAGLLLSGCTSDTAPQKYCDALADAQRTAEQLGSTLSADAANDEIVAAAEDAMIAANRIRDAAFDDYPSAAGVAAESVEPFTFQVRGFATGEADQGALESALAEYKQKLDDLAAEGSC